MAKIDLHHARRSAPGHTSNYHTLDLKWRFSGDTGFTYQVETHLPFAGKSVPGIFYRFTQAVKCMMIRRGCHFIVVYLHNFLVIGNSIDECQAAYDCLPALLLDLGFQLGETKL